MRFFLAAEKEGAPASIIGAYLPPSNCVYKEISQEEYNEICLKGKQFYYRDGQFIERQQWEIESEITINEGDYIPVPPDTISLTIIDSDDNVHKGNMKLPFGEHELYIEPFPYIGKKIKVKVIPTVETLRNVKETQLNKDCNKYIITHYAYSRQNTFKAKFSQIIDELTNNYNNYTTDQITQLQTAKNRLLEVNSWIESVLDYFYQKLDEIKNATDLTTLDNITWDFSQFDATDPKVTIEEIRNILKGVLWA